jgi:hypothetical protein
MGSGRQWLFSTSCPASVGGEVFVWIVGISRYLVSAGVTLVRARKAAGHGCRCAGTMAGE